MKKSMQSVFLPFVFLAVSLSGCSSSIPTSVPSTFTPSPVPPTFTPSPVPPTFTPTSTLTSTPTPKPLMTIKVISYNIAYGAGVDRRWDEFMPPKYRNKNRLPEVVSFINEAQPDIIGIQEANEWDSGTPPIVEQVAEELDMSYYLANAADGFHVVLLTKYKIIATENLSGKGGNPILKRALRATLKTSDGQLLNIFVVHLDPFSSHKRLCQLEVLVDKLEPYKKQITVLMGDMNFWVEGAPEYLTLERAGWRRVVMPIGIDQIWIPNDVNWISQWGMPNGVADPIGLSDHIPVGAEINIYPMWSGTPTSTPFPQTTPDTTVTKCT